MITRINLEDEIRNILLNKILSGVFDEGERVQLDQLEEELGVSRTPILGALKKLASDGLLYTSRGAGFYVSRFEAQDAYELEEGVHMIDSMSCKRILKLSLEERKSVVEQLLAFAEQCQVAYDGAVLNDYLMADQEFHLAVVSFLNNKRVYKFYRQMFRQISLARHIAQGKKGAQGQELHPGDHFLICEYLRDSKPEKLTRLLKEHTNFSVRIILGE